MCIDMCIDIPPGPAHRPVKAGVSSHGCRTIFEDVFGNIFTNYMYVIPSALSGHNNFRQQLVWPLFWARDLIDSICPYQLISKGEG